MSKIVDDYFNEKKVYDSVLTELTHKFNNIVRIIADVYNIQDCWYDFEYNHEESQLAASPKNLYHSLDGRDFSILH